MYFSFHGLTEHERKTGNRYEIDIAITLTTKKPIQDIHQTVDYSHIAHIVSQIMDKFRFKLLEELVFSIIEQLEELYLKNSHLKEGKIKKIWVSASKHNPPTGYLSEKSTVELFKEY